MVVYQKEPCDTASDYVRTVGTLFKILFLNLKKGSISPSIMLFLSFLFSLHLSKMCRYFTTRFVSSDRIFFKNMGRFEQFSKSFWVRSSDLIDTCPGKFLIRSHSVTKFGGQILFLFARVINKSIFIPISKTLVKNGYF